MAKLNKISSGLLFYDDFSEKTLMWTLSPSDANCLSFGDNGLQIKHNKRYVSYTIVEPSVDEYSCIVHLDHVPVNKDDFAGILIMSEYKEYAECQSYHATGPSELVNSDQYDVDVKNLIYEILRESNFVQWSEGDDDIPELTVGDPDTSRVPGSDVNGAFIDTIYHYIKFTKNKYKYIFWASEDGQTWIEVGSVKFDNSGIIGFFLYGTIDKEILEKGHCYFKSFALYNSKYLTFENISKDYECEIIDGNGFVVIRTDDIGYAHMINRSNTRLLLNTATMPMPIKNATLRMYPKDDYTTTTASYYLGDNTYGGDAFTLERNIGLFINNIEINPMEIYNLGTFYRGSYYIKLDVHNKEEYSINDIKLKVIKYSEYYGGEEEVSVALYDEGQIESSLLYKKEVIIKSLGPSQSRSVFMKLTDKPIQDFYMTANDYRFKILIE